MKQTFFGILTGFAICLALFWAVTTQNQPLVKSASAQTATQIQEILKNIDPTLLENIDLTQLENIDPAVIEKLIPIFLSDLDPATLENLDPTLIANLASVVLNEIDPAIINALAPALIEQLSPTTETASESSAPNLSGTDLLDKPIPQTLKSPTISKDVLEYGRLLYVSGRSVSHSMLTELGPLLLQPRKTDTDWILATGDFLSIFAQAARQEMIVLNPPPSVRLAHERMIGAMNDCSLSAQYFENGLDQLQPDSMRLALEFINSCALQVAIATDIMLAIEPTPVLTGTVTLTESVSSLSPALETSSAQAALEEMETVEKSSDEEDTLIIAQGTPHSISLSDSCHCTENLHACTDFRSTEEAQACYNQCLNATNVDIHQLDPNGDGLVCQEE
ncbi:hypothetical protein KFU94_21450 [Chloroflexi bacterium TSY]|nr:hypothetical protein [Chloroflexi bacterium TSY]